MGACSILIQLHEPANVYFAGQQLTGAVVLRSTKDIYLKSINVRAVGEAYISVNERICGPLRRRLRDSETFFVHRIHLAGQSKPGASCSVLQSVAAGEERFEFQCFIPKSVPCSFENRHGCVRYYCAAELRLQRSGRRRSSEAKDCCRHYFTVLKDFDLNNSIYLRQRVVEKERRLRLPFGLRWLQSCSCVSDEFYRLSLCLARVGYVPGEFLSLDFSASDDPIACYPHSIELVQIVRFHTTDRYVTRCYTIGRNNAVRVSPSVSPEEHRRATLPDGELGSQKGVGDVSSTIGSSIYVLSIRIPPVPPTGLDGCNIIDIGYEVKVKIVTGSGQVTSLRLPIVIGTLPHCDLATSRGALDFQETQRHDSVASALSGRRFPRFIRTAPSSYSISSNEFIFEVVSLTYP